MEKLEKPRERGTRSLCGAEGTSEAVSPLLSRDPPRLCDLPRWPARGSASGERSPGPARRRGGSHGAWGAGRSGSPALGPRPPRPPQDAGVRGDRSAPSAPAGFRSWGKPEPGGALAASRAGRRSCPNSRSRSAPPLANRRSGARCRVSSRAATPRRAHLGAGTWAPSRTARGGAGAGSGWGLGTGRGGGREGPRHLRASAGLTCSQRHGCRRL